MIWYEMLKNQQLQYKLMEGRYCYKIVSKNVDLADSW